MVHMLQAEAEKNSCIAIKFFYIYFSISFNDTIN